MSRIFLVPFHQHIRFRSAAMKNRRHPAFAHAYLLCDLSATGTLLAVPDPFCGTSPNLKSEMAHCREISASRFPQWTAFTPTVSPEWKAPTPVVNRREVRGAGAKRLDIANGAA